MVHRPGAPRPARVVVGLLGAVLVLLLTACGGGGGPAPDDSSSASASRATGAPSVPAPDADWKDCPLTGQPDRECATFKVPVDAAKPGSGTLDLAVSRLPATDRKRRVGVLVTDPGGPGLPGRYTPAALLPPQLRALFDIVGLDRRGSGASTPVDCGEPGAAVQRLAKAEAPGGGSRDDLGKSLTKAELTAVSTESAAYVTKCRTKYGELTAHLGTRDAAADLESLRLALGEEKLSLLFLSYGTLLGQEYLRLHPDRVRAAVLDGTADPDRTGAQVAVDGVLDLETASGTEDEEPATGQNAAKLRSYTAGFRPWCSTSGPAECALAPDPVAPLTRVAARTPDLLKAAEAVMVVPADWPGFSRAVAQAAAGLSAGADPADGGTPFAALKAYAAKGFPKDVAAAAKPVPPPLALTLGNHCADFSWPREAAALLTQVSATARRAGKADSAPQIASEYVPCAEWPRASGPAGPLGALTAKAAPRPLIVNSAQDPRTPLAGARAVAERLPGALLTVAGRSHGVTLNGNPCVNTAVLRTLTGNAAPAEGSCPAA
ncbi:alpha/beta fold hydrolase [Streptomyces sp. NPDC091272]|uniref:alpha/beta fold hydrolase n=1 Tax=Streptomyces sp. NPDC091272 TaxID=3365981 RepID=UPI0037F4EF0D